MGYIIEYIHGDNISYIGTAVYYVGTFTHI